MHDFSNPDITTVPSPVVDSATCICCGGTFPISLFNKDSSYRTGHRDRCSICEASPRLSTREHTAMLKELNVNSEFVRRQRWENQDDYRNDAARLGRPMHSSELIYRLRRVVPDLFIRDGNIEGDLAVYRVFGQKQPSGLDYQYLFFMPTGWLPEFSIFEFDKERDVPIRESRRGWRTVLIRLIGSRLLTEEKANEEFGDALGLASAVWRRTLYTFRNGTSPD